MCDNFDQIVLCLALKLELAIDLAVTAAFLISFGRLRLLRQVYIAEFDAYSRIHFHPML